MNRQNVASFKQIIKSSDPSAYNFATRQKWLDSIYLELGIVFMSFEEAKAVIAKMNIPSQSKFYELRRNNKALKLIPSQPAEKYSNEWKGWTDFLGNNVMSFDEARKIVRSKHFTSIPAFQEWAQSSGLNIPLSPRTCAAYRGKWTGSDDWLGRHYRNPILPFKKAVLYLSKYKLKTCTEYNKFYVKAKHAVKKHIPRTPKKYYKHEWKGWDIFLSRNGTPIKITTEQQNQFILNNVRPHVPGKFIKQRKDLIKKYNKHFNMTIGNDYMSQKIRRLNKGIIFSDFSIRHFTVKEFLNECEFYYPKIKKTLVPGSRRNGIHGTIIQNIRKILKQYERKV